MEPKRVPLGEWNHVELYVGLPLSGKTWRMLTHAAKLARAGVPVLLHDPNANASRTARKQSPRPQIRLDSREPLLPLVEAGAITVTRRPPTELLAAARQHVTSTTTGALDAERAVPVAVYLDELPQWDEIEPGGKLGKVAADWLGSRRHYHVSFHGGCQWPRQVHASVFTAATVLWLHRVEDRYDLRRLRDGGVSEEVLGYLPSLEQWHCLEVNRTTGKVRHHEPG